VSAAKESANLAAFRRFEEASNSGYLEAMGQTIDEIFSPDATINTPLPVNATGQEAIKGVFTILHRAYPDLHIAIEDMLEDGARSSAGTG
jgi:hypothetical protein